jgi:hypothetical protein
VREEHPEPRRTAGTRRVRSVAWLILAVLVVIGVAGCWPYVLAPAYGFPKPAPFSGARLWNPYATSLGRWWKANFHAHSHAWGGLTAGHRSAADVRGLYRKLGYDIAGLSNYQQIDGGSLADPDFIPVYEHGYNVHKVHELVIGARRVTWVDFPFGQTLSQKQYVLDRLEENGGIVALAHPWLRNGYPVDQLRYLTHYTLMEVVRQGHVGTHRWDAALSAGHLSWIIADDDEHNLDLTHDVGVSWTMVMAPSKRRADILAALRAGHTYGVVGRNGANDVLVREVALHQDTLCVRTDPGAHLFRFVGQDGALRKIVRDSMQARYVIRPTDTYVRIEIVTARTHMYLNPIVRYAGSGPVRPRAAVDRGGTWRNRGLLMACALFLLAVPRLGAATGRLSLRRRS